MSRAPNGMRCTATIVIQLRINVAPNTIAPLTTAISAAPSNAYCSQTTKS